MVDRATRYQNAMHQIQERINPSQTHAVDIPDNTLERHVKTVSPFIASLCVRSLSAEPLLFSLCAGAPTCYGSSNK